MTRRTLDGHTFEVERSVDLIDVTSMQRADEAWTFVDDAGHEHYWTFNGVRGTYKPDAKTVIPTVRRVVTGVDYWPDGDSYEIAHLECKECGQKVTPRYTSDDVKQYIPGLQRVTYYFDGKRVSEEEFITLLGKHSPENKDLT